MKNPTYAVGAIVGLLVAWMAYAQPGGDAADRPDVKPLPDAVEEAQTPRDVPRERPEQEQTSHDQPADFKADKAPPSSTAFESQPDDGKMLGFDFSRDPLGAKKPMQTFEETMAADVAARPIVMETQNTLLSARYNLEPVLSSDITMTRGKPICVGPTAKLKDGMTFDLLSGMEPGEIKEKNLFPYPPLPHPKHATGGQVFPDMQIQQFPRLQRFDVDFDLPEAFLPEFPPAMFLISRPELGDVSRGEVVSIKNFHHLFKDIITPVQLDGLRLLVTPFPQEEFNATDDRKTVVPSLGVTCLDCHVNGHTTGQFHLNPDNRPQHRRFRLDTTSLRGVNQQQIHGSKRSLRSVEDFTEFEQRTAYFNGDQTHAFKKGANILDRVEVSHMAQFQNMLDFPPRPIWTHLRTVWIAPSRRSRKSEAKNCSLVRQSVRPVTMAPHSLITKCTT